MKTVIVEISSESSCLHKNILYLSQIFREKCLHKKWRQKISNLPQMFRETDLRKNVDMTEFELYERILFLWILLMYKQMQITQT